MSTAPLLGWTLVCALSCGALLLCQARSGPSWERGRWIAKPCAAAAFVGAGFSAGGLDSVYGRWILAGLVLSLLGDVLLLPRSSSRSFLAGIASFGAAHVSYAAAFLSLGFSLIALFAGAVLMLCVLLPVLSWLRPHLEGGFATAVPVYMAIIAAMVVLSGSATAATGVAAIAAGAIGFAASDLFVARQRFVVSAYANGLLGLPLYFGSQLVIASSIAAVAALAAERAA
jgi:uncharacterized membrane protein YhhN